MVAPAYWTFWSYEATEATSEIIEAGQNADGLEQAGTKRIMLRMHLQLYKLLELLRCVECDKVD